jgi:O-antigen/teichoic acid export membrane protein
MSGSQGTGFRRLLAQSMVAEIVVVLGSTATLSIVSRTRTPVDFGLYSVTLRTVGLFQAPLLVGLGVSLPRILPVTDDEQERSQIITAAVTIVAAISLTLAICSLLIGDPLARAVFGSPTRTSELWALVLLLSGSLIHGIAYASSRGRLNFRTANVVLAVNLGLIPLVAALITRGVVPLIACIAAGWLLFSLGSLARQLVRPRGLLRRIRMLISLGWRRVPGEFALFGLTAAPPLIVLHQAGVVEAGRVSLAMTLLTVAGTAVTPFSAVVLPHVSSWRGTVEQHRIAALVRRVVLVAALTVPLTALAELTAGFVVPFVFGPEARNAVPAVRLVLCAVPAYTTYVLLRSLIDGSTDKATTMHLACVAFAVFMVGAAGLSQAIRSETTAILLAAVLALWVLALLMLEAIRRLVVDMKLQNLT